MRTHKLANGPIVLSVTFCERVEGNFGSQIQIGGIDCAHGDDATVYISESTALRQLERIGLTEETVIDQAIHIEQVQKNGRTFTNIRAATPGEVNGSVTAPQAAGAASAPAPSSSPAQRPVASPRSKEDVFTTYRECMGVAIKVAEDLGEVGFVVTTDNVVAMAATIFIQHGRR